MKIEKTALAFKTIILIVGISALLILFVMKLKAAVQVSVHTPSCREFACGEEIDRNTMWPPDLVPHPHPIPPEPKEQEIS